MSILRNINRNVSKVNWKDFRSVHPVSSIFGYDRGSQSVHRYYIDDFIRRNSDKIKGKVLEVGDSMYADQFPDHITETSVIHYAESHTKTSFVGDLTKKETLPEKKFDCFICTQTYNFIYDFQAAIEGSYHVLNKGGCLIATVSGIQQLSNFDATRWGDYWRFTDQACVRAFTEVFGEGNVEVVTYGNVLACVAALEGLTSVELTKEELEYNDAAYQLIVGILAVRND